VEPEIKPTKVELNKETLTIKATQKEQLTYEIAPETATNQEVTWESSDEEVATVDDGLVTGIKEGEATITVTSVADSSVKATCEIKVEPEIKPTKVELNKETLTIKATQKEQLTYEITPETATNQEVTWESSDEEVATVDDGLVTGIKEGEATITVTSVADSSVKATCEIKVEPEIKPTKIELNKDSATIKTGGTEKLTFTLTPVDSTDQTVTWTSNNAAVASVDGTGLVTAKAAGTAVITVTANGDTQVKASCTIKVEAATVEVTDIKLSNNTLALKAGASSTITATVSPTNATNKTVTWTSSDNKIATVSNGTITAKANGKATITAKTANGKAASCTVTVTTDATKVSVVKSLTIVKGKKATLTATISPSTTSNKKLTYKSSNTKVAKVTSKGVITGVAKGTATITVTTANGKKATCKVTIAEVKLNASSAVLQAGKSTTAVKINTKYPTKDTVKSYKSSNTKVATVNSKGKITAKKVGKATITVTMKSGATATCKITVQKAKVVTKKLTLSAKTVSLKKGKSTTLTVTRNPVTATEKITWTTSNSKIAIVKNGKVTAKKAGTATITARASNGKKAICKVTVKK